LKEIKLSERLKRLRLLSGFTQAELAKKVGLTENAIREIEKGRNFTTLDKLIKIADIFNVTLDYLVGRSDN
jgi:transcriptional regulator with XRE-family HTH domain